MSMLELKLHMVMDKLSNGVEVEVDPKWIDEATEMFKESLIKQLTPRDPSFRLRMSNIGRAPCQLQMEKSGAPKSAMPYNHIFRMMYGDATETIVELLCKIAGVNITGGKSQAEWQVGDTLIRGENDIEIDNKVYDTKSTSPWAFDNKWQDGWRGVAHDDAFGYTGQLLGYARGTKMPMGGWIVVNKASGELKVVEVDPQPEEIEALEKKIENTVAVVSDDSIPFARCFEPTVENFRKVPTGSLRLNMSCNFCNYKSTCWPNAVYRPQTGSKAQAPRHYWYSEYAGDKK